MSSASYDDLRRAGHRIVDLVVDYWSDVEDRRVTPQVDRESLFRRFANTLPDDGGGLEAGLNELGSVLDASRGRSHPLYLR